MKTPLPTGEGGARRSSKSEAGRVRGADVTTARAREFRRNQTDAEKRLWSRLRNNSLGGFKFRRQHPIPPYIADFFCEQLGVIIELDGGQHTPEVDAKRSVYLESKGYRILRFWNNEVLSNTNGVLETILNELKAPHPPRFAGALPLPVGEGKKARILIGKIINAHGVKGLVKITPFCDDPRWIETLGPVYKAETGGETLKVIMKNSAGAKFWLAGVEGITERNGAEALRGTELFIDRDKLPAIKEKNTFYHADLIGLKAIDENGLAIGTVIDVVNFGAGDLIEIQPSGGQSFYLPFTKENITAIKKEIVQIKIPEGLIE
jgi:16S rRNA processing protein RimM